MYANLMLILCRQQHQNHVSVVSLLLLLYPTEQYLHQIIGDKFQLKLNIKLHIKMNIKIFGLTNGSTRNIDVSLCTLEVFHILL